VDAEAENRIAHALAVVRGRRAAVDDVHDGVQRPRSVSVLPMAGERRGGG